MKKRFEKERRYDRMIFVYKGIKRGRTGGRLPFVTKGYQGFSNGQNRSCEGFPFVTKGYQKFSNGQNRFCEEFLSVRNAANILKK